MTRCALVLVLLAPIAGAEGPRWRFSFRNGDRVHGSLRLIRDGTLLIEPETVPGRRVRVPLERVVRAKRAAPEEEGAPAPPPARPEILRLRDGTVLLGRFHGIRDGNLEFEVRSIGVVRLAGREVAELLPTDAIVRSYFRSLAEAQESDAAPPELEPVTFALLWRDLGHPGTTRAFRARRELVRAGLAAVPHLRERLRWRPDAPGRVRRLVARLGHEDVAARELAQVRLRRLGPAAQPQLREALRRAGSPEVRARIRALLDALAALEPDPPPAEEVRRVLRAIGVLEQMASPEARDVLAEVANGPPEALTTREAAAALARLD